MNAMKSTDPVILSSARWFWWIAGLSLVNSVLFYSGSNTSFVIGLGLSSMINGFFAQQAVIGLFLSLLCAGVYFFIGARAQREEAWAFYLGLTVYALDALIYLLAGDVMSVAFHGLAIYFILRGLMRLREAVRN